MYHTAIRKLTGKMCHVERKKEKRDIIYDYTNFHSQVYAPMTRTGVYLDAGSEQYNVKNKYTSSLDGLFLHYYKLFKLFIKCSFYVHVVNIYI